MSTLSVALTTSSTGHSSVPGGSGRIDSALSFSPIVHGLVAVASRRTISTITVIMSMNSYSSAVMVHSIHTFTGSSVGANIVITARGRL